MKVTIWRILPAVCGPVLASLVDVTPALAEVCDKVVGDAWTSGHGPVWLLNPAWGGASSVVTVAAVVALGLLIVAPRLGYVLAAVFVALALWEGLLPLLFWMADPDIFDFATEERCLSAPTKLTGVVILLVLAFLSIWRCRKTRASLEVSAPPVRDGGNHA